jgi:hypothetical protein
LTNLELAARREKSLNRLGARACHFIKVGSMNISREDDLLDKLLADAATIGPRELAKFLGRGLRSIQLDASQRPETLPPRFIVPGCRLVRWRKKDVLEWSDALAAAEKEKRERAAEFAKRFPGPVPGSGKVQFDQRPKARHRR